MLKASACLLALTMGLGSIAPATAHGLRHHRHPHHGHWHHGHWHHALRYHRLGRSGRIGVMRDVLVANPYGDVIIDGRTGFHRSDMGIMVPDSEPPSFVLTGRASGSGLGANGLPGRNTQ